MNRFLYMVLVLFTSANVFGQESMMSIDTTLSSKIELGEIVINASRNSTIMKDMPTSITLIGAKQVTENNIQSFEEVSLIAPNFVMGNYGTKLSSPVYIRGVGSKKNSPAVGLYVDGVPYFELGSMNFDFFDIEQIEILKGPQGTLFGRNTMGGLININTLSPLKYQGTRVKLLAAQYGNYNATVGHYGKTSDGKFAYSLTGNYRHNNGFFKNVTTNRMVDKLQSYGFRNRLALHPNSNVLIENIASFEKSNQSGYPYKLVGNTDVIYNDTSSYDRLMFSDGLCLEYDCDNFLIKATVSYQYLKDKQLIDQDFTEKPFYFVDQHTKQNMVSTEATINSKNSGRYSWLFGAFSFAQIKDKTVDVLMKPKQLTRLKNYEEQIMSGGLFHQSELKLFDAITIIAGLRYNYEHSLLYYKYRQKVKQKPFKALVDTTYPDLNEHILLPKLSVAYNFGNSSVYLLYATGYKAGGFNSTFDRPDELKFEKEMSHNFEMGYKQTFLKGKIYADFSLFLSNIEGQQIARSITSRRGTFLQNAGRSQNKGVESSVQVSDLKGFDLNVGYGYTLARILKYEKNDSTNFSGNAAPYIPLNTLNANVAKTFNFNKSGFIKNVRLQVGYQRMGHIYWRIENDFEQRSYGLLNANVSISSKFVTLNFWGKNLTNTTYDVFMMSALGKNFHQQGTPRVFGVTATVNID